MNSYVSPISRNTKNSLSLDWEQMPQSQLRQSRLIATGFLCSLPTFLLTSQFLPFSILLFPSPILLPRQQDPIHICSFKIRPAFQFPILSAEHTNSQLNNVNLPEDSDF